LIDILGVNGISIEFVIRVKYCNRGKAFATPNDHSFLGKLVSTFCVKITRQDVGKNLSEDKFELRCAGAVCVNFREIDIESDTWWEVWLPGAHKLIHELRRKLGVNGGIVASTQCSKRACIARSTTKSNRRNALPGTLCCCPNCPGKPVLDVEICCGLFEHGRYIISGRTYIQRLAR
jgi:hypothetical protein